MYYYWLGKGTDQDFLASLFGENISQKMISNYLSQIRQAIYKDFVPYFLGAHKEREFYLAHNSITAKILHELGDDILCIFVDGTYCGLEKSANNNFQYGTWSKQKSGSLMKPFIICCADGYIIDCY